MDSHDSLFTEFKDKFPELKESSGRAVKVEITPDKGYLRPEKSWTLRIDESQEPSWWSASHKTEAMRAMRQWKKETYALINLKEARTPINPFQRKRKPSKNDVELLKQWDSVRASVGASVGDSVWDSVWDSVRASVRASVWASVGASVGDSIWDSVWAYIGSLFNIWGGAYKFQPAVDLWKRGLVPSFDGKTWRLHSGKKAEIVWEGKL